MKIGIIGTSSSCNLIENNLLQIDPQLELQSYPHEKIEDCISVVGICEQVCDAIIFSGRGVYYAAKSQYTFKKPHTFVAKNSSSIWMMFCQIIKAQVTLDNFSIDVIDKHDLEDVMYEFQIKANNIYSFPLKEYRQEEDYIQWHLQLFQENKINHALTGFWWVYLELTKQGYPVFYLPPTRSGVRLCYEKIKDEYALQEAQYAQIAVQILHLSHCGDASRDYYSNMLKKLSAEQLIIEYVREIQASIFHFGHNEYVIFTNKGLVSNEINYASLYKLQDKIKLCGFTLHLGIGAGFTVYKAEMNARKALNHSLKYKNFSIFLVNEQDEIIGPLNTNETKQYALVSSDKEVLKLSAQSGLSCQSISKIIVTCKARKSKIFDAAEFADCLNISTRSARRILNKLVSVNLGKFYGKEDHPVAGRPKSLIELLF